MRWARFNIPSQVGGSRKGCGDEANENSMRADFCTTGSFIVSSSLWVRGGFMSVVAGVALGFSTLYTCLWLEGVCAVGGSKTRFCGINSGRFEDISLQV